MGLVSPELSLDLKPSYIPETITGFLKQVSMIGDVSQRLDKVDDFVNKLEDEMKKIQVFQRELPLCMLMLNDAIEILKKQSENHRTTNAHQPVLEEFIPLRKDSCGGGGGGSAQINHQLDNNDNSNKDSKLDEEDSKKNWMSSVQLWTADNPQASKNQTLVSESEKINDEKRSDFLSGESSDLSKNKTVSQGFVPVVQTYPNFPELKRKVEKEDVSVPGLSLLVPGIKQPQTVQEPIPRALSPKLVANRIVYSPPPPPVSHGQTSARPVQQPTSRKQRRCWSPELHRRFVEALTQLGGPQVATPKQIRDLMRVDGLTNDEVKSHLQKYRLHTRRISINSATSTKANGLASPWHQDQYPKPSSSQSASPEGPLQFPGITGGDSMEDDDDEKSESYSWKGHVHRPGKDGVEVM